jgi:hypothetical protein
MSKKGARLDTTEVAIMRILENHKGKKEAICSERLAELCNLTGRRLRQMINHLIIEHSIPIGSQDGEEGGYYIITSLEEKIDYCRRHKKRAMTALMRVSRIMRNQDLVTATQLVIGEIQPGQKIPGVTKTISLLTREMIRNPELYKDQIAALKKSELAPLLVDQEKINEINQAASHLKDLTAGILH